MSADEKLVLDKLELQAAEQRNQLHQSATELKGKITATREKFAQKFDVVRNAREHFGAAAGIVAAVAFITGYGLTGMFLAD